MCNFLCTNRLEWREYHVSFSNFRLYLRIFTLNYPHLTPNCPPITLIFLRLYSLLLPQSVLLLPPILLLFHPVVLPLHFPVHSSLYAQSSSPFTHSSPLYTYVLPLHTIILSVHLIPFLCTPSSSQHTQSSFSTHWGLSKLRWGNQHCAIRCLGVQETEVQHLSFASKRAARWVMAWSHPQTHCINTVCLCCLVPSLWAVLSLCKHNSLSYAWPFLG